MSPGIRPTHKTAQATYMHNTLQILQGHSLHVSPSIYPFIRIDANEPVRIEKGFPSASQCLLLSTFSIIKEMTTAVTDENNLPMLQDSCSLKELDAKERKRVQNRVAQRNYREYIPPSLRQILTFDNAQVVIKKNELGR
jgi:hypothetical protein